MPFGPASSMLAHFTRVEVGCETARRVTEGAGAAYVAVQETQLETLERECPISPPGPSVQQLSVDGAMVPLLHREWAEVKTLAIGVVEGRTEDGKGEPSTGEVSYFSRMADHMSFARASAVETHRRGTARAKLVVGVVDGADWTQTFLDLARSDAVRILDWAHASGYVGAVARTLFGQGTAEGLEWLRVQLHELKHGDPGKVLSKLKGLAEELALAGGEAAEVVRTGLDYLDKRRAMIRYAEFIGSGYPIGSGIVESANKLVVEARLKGSGMHWQRRNVDPMLALRNVACNDRWNEAWPQIANWLHREPRRRSAARREARKAARAGFLQEAVPQAPTQDVCKKPMAKPPRKDPEARPEEKALTSDRRPPSNHPWRRSPFGKALNTPR